MLAAPRTKNSMPERALPQLGWGGLWAAPDAGLIQLLDAPWGTWETSSSREVSGEVSGVFSTIPAHLAGWEYGQVYFKGDVGIGQAAGGCGETISHCAKEPPVCELRAVRWPRVLFAGREGRTFFGAQRMSARNGLMLRPGSHGGGKSHVPCFARLAIQKTVRQPSSLLRACPPLPKGCPSGASSPPHCSAQSHPGTQVRAAGESSNRGGVVGGHGRKGFTRQGIRNVPMNREHIPGRYGRSIEKVTALTLATPGGTKIIRKYTFLA